MAKEKSTHGVLRISQSNLIKYIQAAADKGLLLTPRQAALLVSDNENYWRQIIRFCARGQLDAASVQIGKSQTIWLISRESVDQLKIDLAEGKIKSGRPKNSSS